MDLTFFAKWLLGLAAAANLFLGIFVFRKNPRSRLNRLFLGFTLNACVWTIAVMTVLFFNDYEDLLLAIRISHAVAATTPWFIFALVFCFEDDIKFPYKSVILLLALSLILSAASFTPAIIKGVAVPLENKEPLYGPLFPLYTILFSGIGVYTFIVLYRKILFSRGLVRYQYRFFIGGILVSYVMGSLSNIFLPLLGVKAIDLRPFGPVFTLIMIASISYAIVKFRLMDIRLALRKVVANIFTIVLFAGVFISLLLVAEKNSQGFVEANILYFIILPIILTALFYQPVKDQIQFLVNLVFFRGRDDYHDIMLEENKSMISILNMDKLLHFLVDKMVNTISIESAVFFLKEVDGSFTLAAEEYLLNPPPVQADRLLQSDNPLVNYLQEKASIMLLTDLNGMRDAEKRELLSAEMKKLGAEAAVPVLMEGRLEGILFLGYKQSGDPYSREDVHLFSALALHVAVALKNAQLYNEILDIKQYLENILKNMGNGLIAVDAQGRITTFNSSAKKLTGIHPDKDVLGRGIEEVLDPVLADAILHTLKSGRNKSEVEIELPSDLSSSYLCCSTARVGSLETGEQGAIMVLSDLTRIKELEREKNRTEKLASLGKLAAGIAHEIKNPLVSIKTFAELLPEKYDDYEFRHTFSQIVTGEINRINKLIMELLNFSRNNRPYLEKVDIWELMEEVLLLLFPRIDSQKILLHKNCHGDALVVKADREQMKQALFNICVNAVQAMPGGGELWVDVCLLPERVPAGKSLSSSTGGSPDSAAAGKLKIMIKDTGTGIAPEQQNRIFDPFYTTKPDGVGMGLSISHRIITDHGGSVQFFSNSTGTVFEIYLPAAGY